MSHDSQKALSQSVVEHTDLGTRSRGHITLTVYGVRAKKANQQGKKMQRKNNVDTAVGNIP